MAARGSLALEARPVLGEHHLRQVGGLQGSQGLATWQAALPLAHTGLMAELVGHPASTPAYASPAGGHLPGADGRSEWEQRGAPWPSVENRAEDVTASLKSP